ncbi:MAG: MBL fold metallo-hydrolase [Clostridia bacterium]|nr:MBL fold metallo-hydrolase [Clostridia bacterium]
MDIKLFYTGPMPVNTYLCADEESKQAFIVDPGAVSKPLESYIAANEYEIKYIVLTHGHGDHIGGVLHYKELYPEAKVVANTKDDYLFQDSRENMAVQFVGYPVTFRADIYVYDGDKLEVGPMELTILETPGHTPGGISILVGNVVFCGDTLFAGSIGRTDFTGGSYRDLINSVKTKLFTLPDDTFVLPGHMRQTTIGHEKKYNPFF